jgi:hypothetical protein
VVPFGCPFPTLAEAGTLPDGVTFSSITGVLAGTTTAAFIADYPISFTASNGDPSDALQSFILHIVVADEIFADGFEGP